MIVNIQSHQVELDKAIEAHIRRKLTLALSRMEQNITAISIHLTDVINQKGCPETHCYIQISIIDLPDIIIEDTQTDLYFAIDRVIQKASHSLARKFMLIGN